MTRRLPILAVGFVAAGALSVAAQGGRGVPRMPMPEVPPQERAAEQPVFRAAVTRVEVSALVLDGSGTPVRGLTAADFEVLENGVPQIVRSFVPFTYDPSVMVLPDPVLERRDRAEPSTSMPASNYYSSASRVFALILDDLHVDVRRTRVARAAARRLVEQLAATDLLFVTATGPSESTGYFSRDRRHALQMIDSFTGQRLLDKTMAARRFRGQDFEAERLDHYQRLCATIRDVSLALRDISGRRKTVILISEGSSFGAGLSDMTVRMPTPTSGGQANVPTGASRVMNEALAAAAAGNVAIYPLNPAGLEVSDADLIQGQGFLSTEAAAGYSDLLTEARQAKEMSRDLAALTGGVPLIDTNDALAGIDRAVRDASAHYVLTYEPATPPKRREYRRIEVKVRRPGLQVLARRGYSVAEAPPPPAMKVPGSLSPRLRSLLAGVMPDDGLPMRVQAVAVNRTGKAATIAVVVEVNGSMFGGESRGGVLRIEQGVLTLNETGKAANGTRRIFDMSLSQAQWQVLTATGLRSVWAVELPTGRHQLRVASLDNGTGRGGSVYLDIDVSDGSALPLDALVASRALSAMPTAFADQRLAPWTSMMPTATRVFPEGDELTLTVPLTASKSVTARLSNAAGEVMWERSGMPIEGTTAARLVVPLDHLGCRVCDLTVASGARLVRTTIGIVSSQTK